MYNLLKLIYNCIIFYLFVSQSNSKDTEEQTNPCLFSFILSEHFLRNIFILRPVRFAGATYAYLWSVCWHPSSKVD